MEIVIVYGFHGKCYAGREYRSKFVNIFRELIGVEGKLKLGVTKISVAAQITYMFNTSISVLIFRLLSHCSIVV